MIGFDKPVRPEWIHAVHRAWRPGMPVREILKVVDGQAAEMPGAETRSKIGGIIVRCFVETEGLGSARRAATSSLFATLAAAHGPQELAPVYLVHLIAQLPVLQEISQQITRRYREGDAFTAKEFLQRVYAEYGQRGVVYNCVKSFLHTLAWFGPLLARGGGHYVRGPQLRLRAELFPAALYVWAAAGSQVEFRAEHIHEAPAFAFVDLTGLDDWLARYDGEYWRVLRRPAETVVMLRYTQRDELVAAYARNSIRAGIQPLSEAGACCL